MLRGHLDLVEHRMPNIRDLAATTTADLLLLVVPGTLAAMLLEDALSLLSGSLRATRCHPSCHSLGVVHRTTHEAGSLGHFPCLLSRLAAGSFKTLGQLHGRKMPWTLAALLIADFLREVRTSRVGASDDFSPRAVLLAYYNPVVKITNHSAFLRL
jgi:hypothetical protein